MANAHCASSVSAHWHLRCAVEAAGGMSGYVDGAFNGGVKGSSFCCVKVAASCKMPR